MSADPLLKAAPSSPRPEPANLAKSGKLRELVDSYERQLILIGLAAVNGHQRRAAKLLGLLPSTLNEKMRRHKIRAGDRPSDVSTEVASLPPLVGA